MCIRRVWYAHKIPHPDLRLGTPACESSRVTVGREVFGFLCCAFAGIRDSRPRKPTKNPPRLGAIRFRVSSLGKGSVDIGFGLSFAPLKASAVGFGQVLRVAQGALVEPEGLGSLIQVRQHWLSAVAEAKCPRAPLPRSGEHVRSTTELYKRGLRPAGTLCSSEILFLVLIQTGGSCSAFSCRLRCGECQKVQDWLFGTSM